MKNKGFFITIEGIDGSGKSTQTELIFKYFQGKYKDKLDVIYTREPGGYFVSEKIRELILDPNSSMTGLTELMLYEASRAEHFLQKINPQLEKGNIVICERFIDSTFAYQGYARGLDFDIIEKLNSIATNNTLPDVTILFDVDVSITNTRITKRGQDLDRIEKEGQEFQAKVRQGYLDIARKFKERFIVINITNKTIDQVYNETINELEKKLRG